MSDENRIEEFRIYLMDELDKAENTAKIYCRAVDYLFQIVNKPYNQLTLDDLIHWKKEIKNWTCKKRNKGQPIDSNSLTPMYNGVHQYIDFLDQIPKRGSHKRRVTIDYPKKFFKPPSWDEKRHIKKGVTDEEVDKLFETAKYDPRATALLHLYNACGGRVSDISRLKLDSVKQIEEKYYLDRFIKKTKQQKQVKISKECFDAIQEFIKVRTKPLLKAIPEENKDYLFISIYGNRLTECEIWRIMRSLGADAGLEKLTNHMLRHYHATKLAKAGLSISEIAEHMGIKPRTAERYIHFASDDVDKKVLGVVSRQSQPQAFVQPQPETPIQQPQTELDKQLELEKLKAENLRMQLELAGVKPMTPQKPKIDDSDRWNI